MMEIKLTAPCFLIVFLFKGITDCIVGYNCVQPPAYISAWTTMDTSTTTELEFNHGLAQVPYMHEVQIRSSSGFVYPGVKTAFSDNDASTPRGGVVCLYNLNTVKLYAASGPGAYLIHTGQSDYSPDNQEMASSADVRVRLWIASNFPVPDVVLTSTLQAGNDDENRRILVHNLGSIPELTVVQLEVVIDSQVWYGEGVGTSQHLDGNNLLDWGGVVFGVGTTQIKLWAPSDRYHKQGTAVFYKSTNRSAAEYICEKQVPILICRVCSVNPGCLNFCDGWGPFTSIISLRCDAAYAGVTVRMWASLGSNNMVDHSEQHFIGDENNNHEYTINTFDEDNDFITVQSRSIDGSFQNFYFDGTGAAMFDNKPGLGGLIYAYKASTGKLRIWHPNNAGSFIIKVGPYMGSQTPSYAHASTRVEVVTRVWQGSYCHSAPTVNFATVVETLTTATYTCISSYEHTSGDLQLMCDPSYRWEGTLPVCSMLTTVAPTTTPLVTTTLPATTSPATTPPATTPLATTTTILPTTAAPAECTNCVCYNYSSSSSEAIAEAIAIAEQIVANLTIESKSTSKYARSLSSAVDERQSSFFVGMFGAGFCGILMLLIVIPDVIKLASYILCRHTPHESLTENSDEFY